MRVGFALVGLLLLPAIPAQLGDPSLPTVEPTVEPTLEPDIEPTLEVPSLEPTATTTPPPTTSSPPPSTTTYVRPSTRTTPTTTTAATTTYARPTTRTSTPSAGNETLASLPTADAPADDAGATQAEAATEATTPATTPEEPPGRSIPLGLVPLALAGLGALLVLRGRR
jgi:hypothetical protein